MKVSSGSMDYTLEANIKNTQNEAKRSLAEYLEARVWDAYFTVTFAKPANYPRLAIDRVERALYPVKKGFVCAEAHKLGNYHVHGLAEFYDVNFDADRVMAKFRRLGYSMMEGCRATGAVSNYCAKYITKGSSDYDFLGFSDHWLLTRENLGLK